MSGSANILAQTEIREYSLPGQIGASEIGFGIIKVNMPFGTELTGLIAKFRLSKGSKAYVNDVEQKSGQTPNDFTNPVTYTVINERQNLSQDWIIYVIIAPNTETDFLSYSFPEQTGPAIIDTDHHRIDIEVAYGTDVTNLVASFELSYGAVARVNSLFFWVIQYSGITANDFTNPVTYRITAEDGTTHQDWSVTVTVAPQPEAEILAYSLPAQIGNSIIDNENQTVDLNIPYGTDKTNLISSFTLSHNATATVDGIEQISGVTPNDFTDPVIYTVTAYDGVTSKDWTVSVNVLPNNEAEILTFSFPEQVDEALINSRNGTVDIEVAYGTDLTNLVATFTLSPQASATIDGELQISGTTANDFTTPLTYLVSADDNTTKEWRITVTVAPNSENDFLSYSLPGQIGSSLIDQAIHRIEVNLSFTTELDNLVASFTLSPQAYAEVDGIVQESGITPNDFNDVVTYTVIAGDGSTVDWDVIVSVLPNNEANILEFSFLEGSDPGMIDADNHTVQIEVNFNVDPTSLTAVFLLSPLAVAYIGDVPQESGITVNNFSNPVTYTILAGDQTTTQDWEISVTVKPPSSETDFLSFGFEEQIGESLIDTLNHEIFVYVAEGTQLEMLAASFILSPSANAYVDNIPQISGETINDFSDPVEYTIIAEDNITTQTWNVYVSVALDFFYIKQPLEFQISEDAVEISAGSSEYEKFERVFFNYKKIEERNWIRRDVIGNQGIYKFDITKDMIGNLGVYYYFNATDSSGRNIPLEYHHLVLHYNQDYPLIPDLRFGGTVNHYQIISVPLNLKNTNAEMVFDELGEYNVKQWRLFHYDGISTREYKNGFTNIDPGLGYWLIVRNQTSIDTGEGNTVRIDSARGFEIDLEPGWNQIGNPYDMDISWDNVIIDNSNLNISRVKLFYEDSLAESYVIPRYRGGFVFLQGVQPITANVRPSIVNPNARKRSEAGASRYASIDQPEWTVRLNISNGTVSNSLSGIGMHPEATTGMDWYDEVLLPVPVEIIPFELSFNHPDEQYDKFSRDITNTTDHYTWDFEVKGFGPSQSLTISWDNNYLGNNEYNLILNHKGPETIVNMKENGSYTFNASGMNQFRIIFGDDAYINREVKPSSITLGLGYPNPFINQLTIPFTLSDNHSKYDVNISVYDLTGKKIVELANRDYMPGYYSINWNSLEDGGIINKGIYIIKMVVNADNINDMFTRKVIKQ